ncbi:MAG: 30S ribosomal protein S3 [Bryobacterales bacterium]|nr:30S ribosomal protein S3 [Bryobacterales bacterium]
MGQKTHPYGFRLGVTKTWRSRWFAKQDYAKLLQEDLDLKDELRKRLKAAGVSSVEVDRPGNKLRITIRTSRPGIIIGRKGAEIEKLKSELAKRTKREVFIDIQEVSKPDVDAQLVSESIALQLEKRVAFRRAMRKAVDSAKRLGCKGIKVRVSGRLNGAEIARSEWYLDGQLPLHTLRADIDYGFSESHTTYGVIGVKVWIYKGEILGDFRKVSSEPEPRRAPRGERDRGGDRRERRGPGGGGPSGPGSGYAGQGGGYGGGQQHNAPAGPPVQAPPAGAEGTVSRPIAPPMAQPVQPTWKNDAVETATPAVEPVADAIEATVPAVDTNTETPSESQE